MELLDIKTISIITMFFSLLLFIGLFRFAWNNRRFFGFRIFAYGNLFILSGILLVCFQTVLPHVLSHSGSSTMLALAFLFYSMGTASFLRVYFSFQWLHWTALVVLIALLVYFFIFNIPPVASIASTGAFIFGETLYSGILSIKGGKKSFGSAFILFSLYCLFRIILALFEFQGIVSIDDQWVFVIFFIILLFFLFNTAFSLFGAAVSILNKDLEERARLDYQTGALNRRAFLDELNREIARSKRGSLTFSLIMADIDHFKEINDKHGHLAGDSVLMAFTSIIGENLRINDILSRYGEEEFMILLPDTEKKNAFETGERIRKILELNHHHFNGQDIQFTASFGVTSFEMDARNKEELLEIAEMALYEAKSKGRNRVEVK